MIDKEINKQEEGKSKFIGKSDSDKLVLFIEDILKHPIVKEEFWFIDKTIHDGLLLMSMVILLN